MGLPYDTFYTYDVEVDNRHGVTIQVEFQVRHAIEGTSEYIEALSYSFDLKNATDHTSITGRKIHSSYIPAMQLDP